VATPERRARTAEVTMAVVNEHPDVNVRRIYAGQVAAHCDLPVGPLVSAAEKGARTVRVAEPIAARPPRDGAEVVALVTLVHRWDEIAPWLVEALFVDAVNLATFRALAEADGDIDKALEIAEPAARELLERLVVEDLDADPELEARNLIGAATRRELARLIASGDLAVAREHAEVRALLDRLDDPHVGPSAAEQLLRWLDRRIEERR
jgi:DNA primase